jgi:hypothetical protein
MPATPLMSTVPLPSTETFDQTWDDSPPSSVGSIPSVTPVDSSPLTIWHWLRPSYANPSLIGSEQLAQILSGVQLDKLGTKDDCPDVVAPLVETRFDLDVYPATSIPSHPADQPLAVEDTLGLVELPDSSPARLGELSDNLLHTFELPF